MAAATSREEAAFLACLSVLFLISNTALHPYGKTKAKEVLQDAFLS